MNLSSEMKSHILEVIDDRALGHLYPLLDTGQLACKAFMEHNDNFFGNKEILNSVPGHLLSYCIHKQLVPENLPPTFPFRVTIEQINQQNKYKMPILHKDNVSISLIRSRNRRVLDNNDKRYLKARCKANNILDGQISMFEGVVASSEKIHGVLVYGINKSYDSIEFADIVFFESKLKEEYFHINLRERLSVYETQLSDQEKQSNILSAGSIVSEFDKIMEG